LEMKRGIKDYLKYNPETGVLTWRERPSNRVHVGDVAGSPHGNGYISLRCCGRKYYAHRVAWYLTFGQWPNNIDHINGDGTDNRLENLRDVSPTENHRNQRIRKNCLSGHMGVRWSERDKRWRAYITVEGVQKNLGSYKAKADAISARRRAEDEAGFHPNHGSDRGSLTP